MSPAESESLNHDQRNRRRMMGKLVVTEFITLDGVIEDAGGSENLDRGGWAFQFDRGRGGQQVQARRGPGGRGAAPRARDLRGVRCGVAYEDRRVRLRRQANTMPKYV